jgi:putative transposase
MLDTTEEEASFELERFCEIWDQKYPQISKSWRKNWPNLITLFDYPDDMISDR